jgi:hypothetical protein
VLYVQDGDEEYLVPGKAKSETLDAAHVWRFLGEKYPGEDQIRNAIKDLDKKGDEKKEISA